MFAAGDKAFYPAHGVGVIEKIERNAITASDEKFYVVRILDSGMTVTVPLSRATEVGLRPLVSKEKAKEVFSVLKRSTEDKVSSVRVHQPWTRRSREYNAKLKTGCIFDLADILKELAILQNQKQLSFGEKKLMEQVRKLIIKELSHCHDCTEDKIHAKINELLTV